jgi:hypothetical protein
MRTGAEVSEGDAVSVRVTVPRLLPGMPRLEVAAESGLGEGDG